MKKLIAALLTAALVFSPAGNVIFQDDVQTVEAKRYSSGKKSFNTNKNSQNSNNSFFQNKKADEQKSTANKSTANKTDQGTSSKGGFWGGLMMGGLAGLLLGGLLGDWGIFGSILGLLINVLAIVALIAISARIFAYFKDRKKKDETNPWRG